MQQYTEKHLEDHLESRLLASGFRSVHYTAFDRRLGLLPDEVLAFIKDSQPKQYEKLSRLYEGDTDRKIVQYLSDQISKRGIVDVLRQPVKDRGVALQMVFFEPKSGLNPEHSALYHKNRFTLVRQLHFSPQNEQSIDVVLCLNGIPLITLELKNHFTGQTVTDAQKQYNKRNHKELIFQFKRCLVHFCVDNDAVYMSSRLSENTKWLPYNKGIENPIFEGGHKVHYLWDEILQPGSLLDIIENFVMVVSESKIRYDGYKQKVVEEKSDVLLFPRYHQLDAIRSIRKAVMAQGTGRNFLVQHTTGAGKSYEIGWLAHILASLYRSSTDTERIFDSIIVLTDRTVLDKQLRDTILSLQQTTGVVNPVDKTSKQLREYLEKGKDIIISTVQKFPVISEVIGELGDRNFAIIIDEAHSSQSGNTSKHIKKALTKGQLGGAEPDEDETEDYDDIDRTVLSEIQSRGRQKNISYFAFTGTPKGKTLELFGEKKTEAGQVRFVPFHTYTMRQSIAEGFTHDVLAHYCTYERYFKLHSKLEADDREVPKSKVMRQLVHFVDIQEHTIREKVQVMLDHFVHHTAKNINGVARAMLVTRSRLHCVKYMIEMRRQMAAKGLPYSCLCAFSGSVHDPDTGKDYTESSLNGLDRNVSIPYGLKDPRFRILIVANKYQTGFDEPMLHTMFVDKMMSGLQAVQTLSRLNRTMSGKTNTFVLDFVNEPDDILAAFQPYFQSTYLDGETDPNLLYDLERDIRGFHLFTQYEMDEFARIFYDKSKDNELFMSIVGKVVDRFKEIASPEQKDLFKSKVQSYLRLYSYIAQVANFADVDLEKLFVFLQYINKKLPRREQEDINHILGAIDLDSFRVAKTWEGRITLAAEDGPMEPLTPGEGKGTQEEVLDMLSEIVRVLNDTYGVDMNEEHKIHLRNAEKRLEQHQGIQEAFAGDNSESNRQFIFGKAFEEILLSYVNDHFEFYKLLTQGKQKEVVREILYQNYKQRFEGRG